MSLIGSDSLRKHVQPLPCDTIAAFWSRIGNGYVYSAAKSWAERISEYHSRAAAVRAQSTPQGNTYFLRTGQVWSPIFWLWLRCPHSWEALCIPHSSSCRWRAMTALNELFSFYRSGINKGELCKWSTYSLCAPLNKERWIQFAYPYFCHLCKVKCVCKMIKICCLSSSFLRMK